MKKTNVLLAIQCWTLLHMEYLWSWEYFCESTVKVRMIIYTQTINWKKIIFRTKRGLPQCKALSPHYVQPCLHPRKSKLWLWRHVHAIHMDQRKSDAYMNNIQQRWMTSAVLWCHCTKSHSGQMTLLLAVDMIGPEIWVVYTHSSTVMVQGDSVPHTAWW